MKPPPSGRGAGGGWRGRLPGAAAAGKALALLATLGFVTLVGMRAGPAASPPAPAASPPAPAASPAPPSGGAPAHSPPAPAQLAAAPPPAGAAAPNGEAGAAGGRPGAAGILADGRVVVNVASEEELTRLPGVGPTRAKAIVALRSRLGRLRSLNDLRRVKGIGRRSLERLRPHAVLDPPA